MRKISRKTLSLAVLAVSCFNLYAQTQPAAVERPSLTKGDSWTYRVMDGYTSNELEQREVIFADTENDLLVFNSTNKTTNVVTTRRTNMDLNLCASMRNDDKLICQGEMKFPLAVGNKHTFDKAPWFGGTSAGEGYREAKCEVKEAEKVTVPAGTFDTFRVECSGYETRVFNGSYNGSYRFTKWYAPAVKQWVKTYYENLRSKSAGTKTTTELVSYKVQ